MIRFCIVEDEKEQAELLNRYIRKYSSSTGDAFEVKWVTDGIDLVEEYKGQYDIILLDIQMKHLDGMTAAEKIRMRDSDVVIIFVTSTVQYAVQGYSVDALGYVLKPVLYPAFAKLMEKAVVRVKARREKVYIHVSMEDRRLKLDCEKVFYIESRRNNVIVYTETENYVTAGPLKRFEESLDAHGFSKCHNAYLVNLSKVEAVQKTELLLTNGVSLPISRARKKEFLAALTNDIL